MKEKFYITTPIYYVNDAPHLGHAYSSVLTDILARYQRLLDKEVFFLTGTDEHGAKVNQAAEEKKCRVQDLVDENSSKFRELFKLLNISNDNFIRTSDQKKHWPVVGKLWLKLKEQGDIYKGEYKGLYCVDCEAFITEKELVGGKCIYHHKEPEIIEEENYFFKLSKYREKIKELIESGEMKILPEGRRNETLALLDEGDGDVSFSRPSKDVKWGIPVPADPSQIIYVWPDALSNYLSGLDYGKNKSKFDKFWPADLHILGKDIMRFHTIIWPAILLSVGLSLPKNFMVHGFILSQGKKMSKTIGNVIDPLSLIKSYGVDSLRHYFSRGISPFEDGDITEDKFKEVYNADLANGLGNYVSRVFKMAFSYFEGVVKKPDGSLLSQVLVKEKGKESFAVPYLFEHIFWPEYKKYMEELRIDKAANVVWQALSNLDSYIQDYQPFKMIQSDRAKTEAVLWSLLNGLANICWMISPFIPETSEKIRKGLGIIDKQKDWDTFSLKSVENLFPRK